MSGPDVDLGFRPRKWQEGIFKSLVRFSILVIHRRAGKTILAIMRLMSAAIACKRERGRFAYLAPELKQAKGIAWDYLKGYATKIPGTRVNESELYVELPNGSRITLYGADNINALRGYHFDGIVIDEVAEMPLEIWGLVLLPAISDKGRLGWALFIGTPHGINLFSKIYFGAIGNREWFHKLLTVYETGLFTNEDIEAFKREMTPNQFRQEFLCDFGASNDNCLISIEQARAAMNVQLQPHEYTFAPKVMGVDVAWTGGDRCVVFKRQGLYAWDPLVIPGLPEKTFASKIASVMQDWKPDAVFIDTTGGYGGEVVSRLREWGFNVQEVKFSWKGSERFANLRAEMWWKMAQWVKEGARLPRDEGLIAELTCPTYSNDNAANRITLESKDDIKKRLGFSPDVADSLALSFAFPVHVQSPVDVVRAKQNTWDFDPIGDDKFGKDIRPSGHDFDPLTWK